MQLSDDALELADRNDLDEGVLRYVAHLPSDDQVEMIQQIIQFSLTSRQVRDICQQGLKEEEEDTNSFSVKATRFARMIIKELDKQSPQELAQILLSEEKGNANLARARLQNLVQFATQAEMFLEDN